MKSGLIKKVRGISVANPVEVEENYLMEAADYAIKNGYNHFQFIGPIHNPVKGNVDGITLYEKYARFNKDKDLSYARLNIDLLNRACDKLSAAGIKTYMWHHELELPADFSKEYPEVLNDYGDVEVSHPLVKDFLENKIRDFFASYKKMDGIILTLHETRIPLLKLKNQKLGKVERVQYVTKILYDACASCGKELIVRPFASIAEDYDLMLGAYEKISTDLVIMDKWTQFDWSLTLPHNRFFEKIKNNPLLVEADIFGEFFGKGLLPLYLKHHITEKFSYCEKFSPIGYVSRIDRENRIFFGTVNCVNLALTTAVLSGRDPERAAEEFFAEEYGDAADNVRALMEPTEELNRKLLTANGYYFMQQSFFPTLNHCKNHFYFDLMKEKCDIASDEWFIPANFVRGDIKALFTEKEEVVCASEKLLKDLVCLKSRMSGEKYRGLYIRFANLCYAARAWRALLDVLYNYVKFFETGNIKYEGLFIKATDNLALIEKEGREKTGDSDEYYLNNGYFENPADKHIAEEFINDVKECFEAEKKAVSALRKQNPTDFVVCGGATEGHRLKKEVNFSDTMLVNGKPCRIPGNKKGAEWCAVNAHGWFSYEIAVRPNSENTIILNAGSLKERFVAKITVGDEVSVVDRPSKKDFELTLKYKENLGAETARIRIERISGHTPLIYSIRVL